jgi:hypothetical protein
MTAVAVPRTSSERIRVPRTLGVAGLAGGVLFAVMSVWQHTAGLESGSRGTAAAVNQGGFALAMLGYVALAVGLHWARPGGDSKVARLWTVLLVAAWAALLAGLALEALTPVTPESNLLGPIAGLCQGIALVGLGIGTAVAGRWSGWCRFWGLGLAVYYVGVLFVPAILGFDPNVVTETIWGLGYAGLGAALVVSASSTGSASSSVSAPTTDEGAAA